MCVYSIDIYIYIYLYVYTIDTVAYTTVYGLRTTCQHSCGHENNTTIFAVCAWLAGDGVPCRSQRARLAGRLVGGETASVDDPGASILGCKCWNK